MTQHALATPFLRSGQGGRRNRADVMLGVFSNGRDWKVYSQSGLQFGDAAAYPSREEALVAAEQRAFAAAQAGRHVELFVEYEDGSLAQAWPR